MTVESSYALSREAGAAVMDTLPLDAESLGPVIEAIGKSNSDGGTWFALAEALLIVTTRSASAWAEALAAHNLDGCLDLLDEIAAAITKALSSRALSQLGIADATEIIRLAETYIESGAPWIVVAAALLDFVDENRHETFDEIPAASLRTLVRPRRAYPVSVHDPRQHMGESANTSPHRLPSALPSSVATHIRLGTQEHEVYRVVIDWDLKGRLAPLFAQDSIRIATGHVHGDIDDFEINGTGVPEGRLANRGPKQPDRSVDEFARLVSRCSDAAATFIVLPEYAVSPEMHEPLLSRVEAMREGKGFQPLLLVAGTALMGDLNEALLVVNGPLDTWESKTTTKFTRADILGVTEHMMAPQPEITVWRSGQFGLAVLICRDASDVTAVGLLAQAGVSVVLVPSFSDRIATLTGIAGQLAVVSQAYVAVAVAPRRMFDHNGQHEAYFRGPFGADDTPPDVYLPETAGSDEPELPCAWLFDSRWPAGFDPGEVTGHLVTARHGRAIGLSAD